MRLKSNSITIEYAGQVILSPGGHINGQDYGGSRSFTTSAASILDAANPEIRAFGNAQGSQELQICVDFEKEDDALAEAMARVDHCETNQTGLFTLTIGDYSRSWKAGITSIDWRLSYTPDRVRLALAYSFTLGSKEDNS